jgi:RNA polymerase sigma factor (sigma-70 family)
MPAPTLVSAIHRARSLAAQQGVSATDAQLLDRYVRQRDEPAFELLVWRHGAMVHGVCLRILGHSQDAEDVFQATFLALVRQAASLGQRETLGGWLHRVASRIARRARAQTARRLAREQNWQPAAAPDGSEEVESRDLRAVLDEELGRLPDRLRVPFVLCHLEGRTNEAAARELGCPAGTIKSRLAEARSRLGQALARRGVALSGAGVVAALASPAAGMPAPALVISTVGTASHYLTGGAAAAGLVAPRAVALAGGVFRDMFLNKLKTWMALALLVGVTAVGFAASRDSAPPAADRRAAPREARAEKPRAALVWQRRETKVKKDKAVTVATLSPDGKTLAVGLRGGGVRFYDVATGKKRAAKKEHIEEVECLAFSADGKKLASGSAGKKVLVFKVATGKLDRTCDLRGNAGLAFSANGKQLLAGFALRGRESEFGSAAVVDLATGKAGVSVSAGGKVHAVAFAHAGLRAVAVCAEPGEILASRGLTKVCLYDFEEVRLYDGWLKGHKGDVRCAAFSPDDEWLATGGDDKRVIVWDLKRGGKKQFAGHTATVRAVAFSKDGKRLASVGDDNTVRVWDLPGNKQLAELKGHKDGLRAVHLSADGKKVTAVSSLGEVAVWELARKPARP